MAVMMSLASFVSDTEREKEKQMTDVSEIKETSPEKEARISLLKGAIAFGVIVGLMTSMMLTFVDIPSYVMGIMSGWMCVFLYGYLESGHNIIVGQRKIAEINRRLKLLESLKGEASADSTD